MKKVVFIIVVLSLFVYFADAQTVWLNDATNGTTVNTCNAMFYDNGGPSANYTAVDLGPEYIITFCSNGPGTLQAKFTAFDIVYGNWATTDTLFIYDGPNINSPVFNAQGYGNYNAQELLDDNIVSTSGCLTFRFKTATLVQGVGAGWEAKIFCCDLQSTSSVSPTTSCSSANGSATINPSNGTSPYQYLWSPNANNQTTQTASNLSAGMYNVRVTDSDRCFKYFDSINVVSTQSLNASVSGIVNNNQCIPGSDSCIYNGPSVVINEIMVMPGNTYGTSGGDNTSQTFQAMYNTSNTGGEWIELYNPSPCDPIDLSCFVLASATSGSDQGAFAFPQGTIIPPLGFLVVGATNAANVDINLNTYLNTQYLNGTSRWHLNNGSGWIAIYNQSLQIVDGVYWGQNAGVINTASEFNYNVFQIVPSNKSLPNGDGCNHSSGVIAKPNSMVASFSYVGDNSSSTVGSSTIGKTIYRSTDGASTWIIGGIGAAHNTPGSCNGVCAPPFVGGSTCSGAATIVATNGTGTYNYSWSHNPSQNVNQLTNLCTGSYTVTVTSGGCQGTVSFNIINEAAPALQFINVIDAVCQSPGEATVVATGGVPGYQYAWNTVPIQTTDRATNLSQGTYTVVVTDNAGCTTSGTVTINQTSSTITATSTITQTTCGSNNGSIVINALPVGNYIYTWAPAVSTTNSASGLSPGNYSVTVSDGICPVVLTMQVLSSQLPSLQLVSVAPENYGNSDGTATVIAQNGTAPYSYVWNTTPHQTGPTATNLVSGSYSVTVTDANSCSAVLNVVIPVVGGATLTTNATVEHCGQSDGTATVNVITPAGAYTILWSTGDTTLSVVGLSAGVYTVTVTDQLGTYTSSVTIGNQPGPVADFRYSPQRIRIDEPTVSFINQTSGNYSNVDWQFGDGGSSNDNNPSYTYTNAGEYMVVLTVSDAFGCIDSISKNLIILPVPTIYIPNAFSPDGDGINEGFGPKGVNLNPTEYLFTIFNRWGEVVFETKELSVFWNGKYRDSAETVPVGVYVYKLFLQLPYEPLIDIIGTVTVVR